MIRKRDADRFFKTEPSGSSRDEILRRHPAFLLAKDELTLQGTVIDALRRVRKQKGYTQRKVALMANLSQSYVARLECGMESNPGILSLEKIAKALDRRIVVM